LDLPIIISANFNVSLKTLKCENLYYSFGNVDSVGTDTSFVKYTRDFFKRFFETSKHIYVDHKILFELNL